jgi:hypothetical protein
VSCLIVEEQWCEVNNVFKLNAKILSFLWGHKLKILRGGPFPVIFGLDLPQIVVGHQYQKTSQLK